MAEVLDGGTKDSLHVYLRLFWRYWPDELPSRRQPYHDVNEFIRSNAIDTVDAMTVAGPAEVSHWDEQKDNLEDLGQIFQAVLRHQKPEDLKARNCQQSGSTVCTNARTRITARGILDKTYKSVANRPRFGSQNDMNYFERSRGDSRLLQALNSPDVDSTGPNAP